MKPDERPILMCRLECPAELLGMLDDWIPKHLDDSLAHPSVTSAGNYEIIRDFSSLPSALNHEGNRMVNYATNDLEGCLEWLDSEELRGAIEDGVDRESQYPPLDGEPFIGNIYVPGEVVGGSAEDFIRDGTWYVERFEVPGTEVGRFEAWSTKQMHELAALEGVARARACLVPRRPEAVPFRSLPVKREPHDLSRVRSRRRPDGAEPGRAVRRPGPGVGRGVGRSPHVYEGGLTRNIVVRP